MPAPRLHGVTLNSALRALLTEARILPNDHWAEGLDGIDRLTFPADLKTSAWTRHPRPRPKTLRLASLGYFSYSASPTRNWHAGAYAAIGPGVSMVGHRHPIERVTSHSMTYGPFTDWAARDMGLTPPAFFSPLDVNPDPAVIGPDVWIGEDVLIGGGISIGPGAVLGARSVVTRDVPPYAVVAGVPAKVVKYRFSPELIARLIATRWWDYDLAVLSRFSMNDPAAFCDAFEAARPSLAPRPERWITAADLLALADS